MVKVKEHYAKEWMKGHYKRIGLKNRTKTESDQKLKVSQTFEQLQEQTKIKLEKAKAEIRDKVDGVRRQATKASDKRKEFLGKQCEKNQKSGKEGLAKSCGKKEAAEKAKAAALLKSE